MKNILAVAIAATISGGLLAEEPPVAQPPVAPCPDGYVCTPVEPEQPIEPPVTPECPKGYVCTPVEPEPPVVNPPKPELPKYTGAGCSADARACVHVKYEGVTEYPVVNNPTHILFRKFKMIARWSRELTVDHKPVEPLVLKAVSEAEMMQRQIQQGWAYNGVGWTPIQNIPFTSFACVDGRSYRLKASLTSAVPGYWDTVHVAVTPVKHPATC